MTGIYRLRDVTPADKALILRWRNSERVRAVMRSDRPIPPEEHDRWFAELLAREDRLFYVFEKWGKPLGIMRFSDVSRENGTCSWGFYLGERNLPRGTGTYLACLGLMQAFDVEGFRKVCAEVLSSNVASYRLHKKMGFRLEGCLRRHIRRGAGYEDVFLFALFKEDWDGRKGMIASRLLQE
jgi:UDP-4-amino-4,6-dideoxy-N-acetyl-beta-L-altrosamine N-acetyltransferase